MVKVLPEDYHSVTPMFMFRDACEVIEFCKLVFGAKRRFAMPRPAGNVIMHAELRIVNSIIMMGGANAPTHLQTALAWRPSCPRATAVYGSAMLQVQARR